jgi:hypothetical protein
MKDELTKFVKAALYVALGIYLILFLILCVFNLMTPFRAVGFIGWSVLFTTCIMTIYEKWMWRFNPFSKIPRLAKNYEGTLEYNFDGQNKTKNIMLFIKQTLLTVSVKIKTDEITSYSITSDFSKQAEDYILYYTYQTNPKSKYSERNPMQFGTCRLELDENNELYGKYWTTQLTKGDMYLKKTD